MAKVNGIYYYKQHVIAEIDEELHSELMKYWGEEQVELPNENIKNYICNIKDNKCNYWDAICAMKLGDKIHLFGESFNHKENAFKWIANEYEDLDELLKEDRME